MKAYTYEGIEYKSESQVRKVVWLKHKKALPKLTTVEDWANHGVTVTDVTHEPKPIDPERVANHVRKLRDERLAESDYYLMPDYPSTESDLLAVKRYRQELRDITKQEGFPFEIEWPVKPSVLG